MIYSAAQLEQLWIQAGGPAAAAPTAAAIALAESSGNPTSNNYTDNHGTQTSWGLWQISNGTHNMPVPNIDDPLTNAQAAVAKYTASGWEPWGTYTSGAYTKYLAGALGASSVARASTAPPASTDPAAAAAAPSLFRRLGTIFLGLVLVWAGLKAALPGFQMPDPAPTLAKLAP